MESEKISWYWLHVLATFQKKCHQWKYDKGSIRQSKIPGTRSSCRQSLQRNTTWRCWDGSHSRILAKGLTVTDKQMKKITVSVKLESSKGFTKFGTDYLLIDQWHVNNSTPISSPPLFTLPQLSDHQAWLMNSPLLDVIMSRDDTWSFRTHGSLLQRW